MEAPSQDLVIAAGPSALKHIRENGLSPNDISTIFGASGAAKWWPLLGSTMRFFRVYAETHRPKAGRFIRHLGRGV